MDIKWALILIAMCGLRATMAEFFRGSCERHPNAVEGFTWDQIDGEWHIMKQTEPEEWLCGQAQLKVLRPIIRYNRVFKNPENGTYFIFEGEGKIPLAPTNDLSFVELTVRELAFVNKSRSTIGVGVLHDEVLFEVLATDYSTYFLSYMCWSVNAFTSYQVTQLLTRLPEMPVERDILDQIDEALEINGETGLDSFNENTQSCQKLYWNNMARAVIAYEYF